MNRLLRRPPRLPLFRSSTTAESGSTKSGMKGPIMGVAGVWGFGIFISSLTQMPLDPERMTPEKQSKMTQKDIEEYEKEMLSKNMAQQIWMQVPAGWRFAEGLKVVWEKTCEAPHGLGFKPMVDYFFEVSEPEWEVALPPPLEPPFIQPRFTVTMELLDVLLCPCYDASSGWRFKLRHGAAYFLKKIGYPNTELCLYTEASPGDVQIPLQRLMKKMEAHELQNGGFLYHVYRNCCKFESRGYLKDLSILGRDLKNVIHIDLQNDHGTTPMLHDYHNRNVILIRRPRDLEEGEMDMTLFDLADFIVSITSDPTIDDVREEMEKFREEDDTDALLTDVYRSRQADIEFDKMAQAEIEEKLREQGMSRGAVGAAKKRGRFF